ncbi:hypothetical protein OE88DRAFT_1561468 [Heliocybe sulcata]|uniref:Uncharacterized protein n=1 Tax=Heliocybe sulcata TaxID=5364 RepID=A0A5C3N3B7_9AGAM|nr:hypothetical protein OE88DRAFT_1561468 [Heliocybe sulcata]
MVGYTLSIVHLDIADARSASHMRHSRWSPLRIDIGAAIARKDAEEQQVVFIKVGQVSKQAHYLSVYAAPCMTESGNHVPQHLFPLVRQVHKRLGIGIGVRPRGTEQTRLLMRCTVLFSLHRFPVNAGGPAQHLIKACTPSLLSGSSLLVLPIIPHMTICQSVN